MEPNEIRFLGDMQRLELKPGDSLVLKAKQHLTDQARHHLEQTLIEKFPGVTVVVLDAGLDIGVVGKGE